MGQTVRFTRTQLKRVRLKMHYALFQRLFRDKFPESNFVPGVGNVNSKIVFVGEAPGRNENEQRKPFVGASGELLDKWLKHQKIKREDIFITNFMHYQPPKNRDPQGDEIPVAMQLLRMELSILDPQMVVTLGRFSTSIFYENPHMGTLAGKVNMRRGFIVMPMYHPAAALYDTTGEIRALSEKHMEAVGDIFHGHEALPLTKVAGATRKERRRVTLTK
jgi:uracil-DNA glycosylase